MSNRELGPVPVIEWSPAQVRLYSPATGKVTTGADLRSIQASLNGTSEVVVALSRRASFLRTARLPDASKAEVSRILALQLGQLFPIAPEDAAVDFYLTEDRNVEGRLAVVAAVKSDTLHALQEELEASGLKVRAVVPSALGSAMLAKQTGRRECAIVEAVPEGLAIDIVSEGELRSSRVVPMPEQDMVDAEVSRSFAVAKVPNSEALTVGGFNYAESSGHLEGSGLSTLAAGTLPLNLEPPEIVLKRSTDRLSRARLLASILWLTAILSGVLMWNFRTADSAVIEAGDVKWRLGLNALRKTRDQATTKLTSLKKVDGSLKLAFEPKQKLSDVAYLLNANATEGLWLTGVVLERGKLAQIRGTATTPEAVYQYLQKLSTMNRFRDVKLVFANNGEIEKVSVVQFSISLHVVGNLPLDSEVSK